MMVKHVQPNQLKENTDMSDVFSFEHDSNKQTNAKMPTTPLSL